MAKLQNPVKSSFDSINDSLKESHSSLNKYSKALDKVSRGHPLISFNCPLTCVVLQRQTTPEHRA